jgi:hypothetical protein
VDWQVELNVWKNSYRFKEELDRIVVKQHTTKTELARQAGITYHTLRFWTTGEREPTYEHLDALVRCVVLELDKARLKWAAGYVPTALLDLDLDKAIYLLLKLKALGHAVVLARQDTDLSNASQHNSPVIEVRLYGG